MRALTALTQCTVELHVRGAVHPLTYHFTTANWWYQCRALFVDEKRRYSYSLRRGSWSVPHRANVQDAGRSQIHWRI